MVVVPYRKWTSVLYPSGLTEPLSVADSVVMLVAELVVTIGGPFVGAGIFFSFHLFVEDGLLTD